MSAPARSPSVLPRFSRWTLGFEDRATEDRYWERFARTRVRLYRIIVGTTLLLVSSFTLVDWIAFPQHFVRFTAVRFGVVLPLYLAIFAGLWWQPSLDWMLRHVQSLTLTLVLVMAAYMAWIGWVLAPELDTQGMFVTALSIYFVFFCVLGISGIRFLYALGLAGASLATWVILVGTRADPDPLVFSMIVVMGLASAGIGLATAYVLEFYGRRDFVRAGAIALERQRSEELILNVLPPSIAERLRFRPGSLADRHPGVTVLFADLVGFTALAERLPADELVAILNEIFSLIDERVDAAGVEKIKTIGDAYMVAAGVPHPREDHALAVARVAFDVRSAVHEVARRRDLDLEVRIGIHSGPVVAGVIGRKKFAYDLWGDTVNTASRMESHGEPGRIQVSAATERQLRPAAGAAGPDSGGPDPGGSDSGGVRLEERGVIDVKGKGRVRTWWLERGP